MVIGSFASYWLHIAFIAGWFNLRHIDWIAVQWLVQCTSYWFAYSNRCCDSQCSDWFVCVILVAYSFTAVVRSVVIGSFASYWLHIAFIAGWFNLRHIDWIAVQWLVQCTSYWFAYSNRCCDSKTCTPCNEWLTIPRTTPFF